MEIRDQLETLASLFRRANAFWVTPRQRASLAREFAAGLGAIRDAEKNAIRLSSGGFEGQGDELLAPSASLSLPEVSIDDIEELTDPTDLEGGDQRVRRDGSGRELNKRQSYDDDLEELPEADE